MQNRLKEDVKNETSNQSFVNSIKDRMKNKIAAGLLKVQEVEESTNEQQQTTSVKGASALSG